ncbi:uncharacterized protein LACBIDRAFT_305087 [Laccaria bicolor S238N-H82]|uniref:Predicted protein n=1 Tax=Laccaria bicolor (strain S238N-H82 / ATCC MYA-4686) TaxID=486041 RepID=B0CTD9_LACBS|nr:uncharacterized protein LACBIDRAFT_305087 [Laccaria bicolor S238N-H82]EDR13901.1 predicted protein [Laccaria bicolor S238N-H82]|eukprot:XP_001874460.1 predicted protein [Laccaria bicolor S238N-H82]
MPKNPVVELNDLTFDRVESRAMIGIFTATTDSVIPVPIEVEATIKYGTAKIGRIKSQVGRDRILFRSSPYSRINQTLDFSNGSRELELEAHFFENGTNLNSDGMKFFKEYLTTENDIPLILNTTSALELKAQIRGIATLGVTGITAWVRLGILGGNADYTITIKHPLQQFKMEIVKLNFVATVGGDDLLEGGLDNFTVEKGVAEGKTDRTHAKLCKNVLTSLWDISMYPKVSVAIRSANVKFDGLPINGLQFDFKNVDFNVDGPVVGALPAGLVTRFLPFNM